MQKAKMYAIFSMERGYVVWEDGGRSANFDNVMDLGKTGELASVRVFEKSELPQRLKTYRTFAPDAKVCIITFETKTIEDAEIINLS